MSAPIRIAVLHYHLRHGGVSQVIGHAYRALEHEDFQMAAIIGEAAPRDAPLPTAVVPELAYGVAPGDIGTLVSKLRAAAAQVLGGPPDIWHIHNHSLGKNRAMPLLVGALAAAGERLLLQPHDFAEDCRPRNYELLRNSLGNSTFEKLYPHSPRLRYALLNGRDRNILQAAGAPPERLHHLPNPVPVFPDNPTPSEPGKVNGSELVIYPTRAIRRKNLGELLLWAALTGDDLRFGVTLAPENPSEQPLYLRWRRLAQELRLPIEFELGRRHSLALLFAASRAAISTSLAEGFGLAFLEPWMAACPLVGRRLPEICSDFAGWGIELGHCYERIDIPLDWIGRESLLDEWRRVRAAMLALYGVEASDADFQRLVDSAIRAERVDFGALGEARQARVIRQLSESAQARSEIVAGLDVEGARDKLDLNRSRIASQLGLARYAGRLGAIYRDMMEAPREAPQYCDPGGLLAGFLAPERFRMILAEQMT
jgi:glycosyltransferase involved in cell wall biosynthesis